MLKISVASKPLQYDPHYHDAELTLPATKAVILDALDRARVPYGSGEYVLHHCNDNPGYIKRMLENPKHNPSLAEMNHLAERLETLRVYETVGSIVEFRGAYDVKTAINATHNLNKYEYLPCATTIAELGEYAIENSSEILPLIEEVPDELLDCLDPAKVGAFIRSQNRGAFTGDGYVFENSGEWREVYDGESLAGRGVTLEPGEPIISLYLRHCDYPDDEDMEVKLDCPAAQEALGEVLRRFDAHDSCDIFIVAANGIVPELDSLIAFDSDIELVNELAGVIKSNGAGQLAKYKAVLDHNKVKSAEEALRDARRLDEYEYTANISPDAFGRQELEKLGVDVKAAEQSGMFFARYGDKAMEAQGIRPTAYGFIRQPQTPEQALAQEEPEQAPAHEQTIGGM